MKFSSGKKNEKICTQVWPEISKLPHKIVQSIYRKL